MVIQKTCESLRRPAETFGVAHGGTFSDWVCHSPSSGIPECIFRLTGSSCPDHWQRIRQYVWHPHLPISHQQTLVSFHAKGPGQSSPLDCGSPLPMHVHRAASVAESAWLESAGAAGDCQQQAASQTCRQRQRRSSLCWNRAQARGQGTAVSQEWPQRSPRRWRSHRHGGVAAAAAA